MKQFSLSKIKQYRQSKVRFDDVIDIEFPNEITSKSSPKGNDILIYVVDDDPHFMQILNTHFSKISESEVTCKRQIIVRNFATGRSCIQSLENKPDLIFLNYNLNKGLANALSGKDTYEHILEQNPNSQIIILNRLNANLRHAIQEEGLRDYIISDPAAVEELNQIIKESLMVD